MKGAAITAVGKNVDKIPNGVLHGIFLRCRGGVRVVERLPHRHILQLKQVPIKLHTTCRKKTIMYNVEGAGGARPVTFRADRRRMRIFAVLDKKGSIIATVSEGRKPQIEMRVKEKKTERSRLRLPPHSKTTTKDRRIRDTFRWTAFSNSPVRKVTFGFESRALWASPDERLRKAHGWKVGRTGRHHSGQGEGLRATRGPKLVKDQHEAIFNHFGKSDRSDRVNGTSLFF